MAYFTLNIRYAFHVVCYYFESVEPENRKLNEQKGQNR